MEIRQISQNGKGSFKAFENDQEVGTLDYTWDNKNTMLLNHTGVIPAYEGKGIAKKLVMESVAYARQQNLKILPRCPYAEKLFERSAEIQDVLYKSQL
ncbi:MAG TPA: GNAT family N-acetyltransferase [Prolixibacteraceae bacterium]|nr:GNAT family N-acetyltransferase [Prolixibacteraceae bacterium]